MKEFLRNELDPEYDLPYVDPAYHPEQLTDVKDLKDLVAGGIDLNESVVYPFRLPEYPLPDADITDILRGSANYNYPYQVGVMELIRDGRGSSLGDLGRQLAAVYPWSPGAAAWFALTGEVPQIEPLRLSYDEASGTFTLNFMPWVSKQPRRPTGAAPSSPRRRCGSGRARSRSWSYRPCNQRTGAMRVSGNTDCRQLGE